MNNADLKLKICVSGATETGSNGIEAMDAAKALGAHIAKTGIVLITNTGVGFPMWSAIGAKEAGGMVIGISPAGSEKEHVEVFNRSIDYHDLIIYSGLGTSGSNILLIKTADAVVVGCGRINTINEFTVAYEENKPIGVLKGEWDTDELLETIIESGPRTKEKIIFDHNARLDCKGRNFAAFSSGLTARYTQGERP